MKEKQLNKLKNLLSKVPLPHLEFRGSFKLWKEETIIKEINEYIKSNRQLLSDNKKWMMGSIVSKRQLKELFELLDTLKLSTLEIAYLWEEAIIEKKLRQAKYKK